MSTGNDLIRDLANAATNRIDGVEERLGRTEDRVRDLELHRARLEGNQSTWARIQPWLTTAIAAAALGHSIGLF
jgi:hypothetical protein